MWECYRSALVQWLSWVFATQERKKERPARQTQFWAGKTNVIWAGPRLINLLINIEHSELWFVENESYTISIGLEYPSGFSQKNWPVAHFVWYFLPVAHFISLKIWPAANFFIKNLLRHYWSLLFCLPIHWWWKWFELKYSVITTTQFVPHSNEEKSNNKPFVKPTLLRYKSHNTNSMPKQFIRNHVRQHT